MPIWAIPAIAAFVVTVAALLSLQRRERWRRFKALGQQLGATEKSAGFHGTDHLVLEGRHDGKRFLLSFFIGSEHAHARLILQMLVRPPSEGSWRSAADLPQGFSKEAGAALFQSGATELEADDKGVRASIPGQLSEDTLSGKATQALDALGKLTKSFPSLDRNMAAGMGQPIGPIVELALLGTGVFVLYAQTKGQTLDVIGALFRALPFALAAIGLRDWLLRKSLHRFRPGRREAIRRGFWGFYFIVILMTTYSLNQWLDRSPVEVIERRLLEARIERKAFREVPLVYVQLGEDPTRTRVEVTEHDLEKNPSGMKIWLRRGAFNVPWMERYEMVEY